MEILSGHVKEVFNSGIKHVLPEVVLHGKGTVAFPPKSPSWGSPMGGGFCGLEEQKAKRRPVNSIWGLRASWGLGGLVGLQRGQGIVVVMVRAMLGGTVPLPW